MKSLVKILGFCLMLICFDRVAILAKKITEAAGGLDPELKSLNDTSSESSGPPDSHEAMNNREIHPIVREKRSYEFLMGLINNNSRYEVMRVDPGLTTQKPKIIPEGVNASELLLELIVRIASHPDQWDKVHNLLQTIDQDLKTSRNVVTKLQALSNDSDSNNLDNKSNKSGNDMEFYIPSLEKNVNSLSNNIKDTNFENKWPDFDLEARNIQIVNNTYMTQNETGTHNSNKTKSKISKSAYPKNFTYHRVTGKPDNTSKNPRAYIAVSVIAPKPIHTGTSEEDIALENELHLLKPWSHVQNLKNMKSIRAKWVKENHQKNKNS